MNVRTGAACIGAVALLSAGCDVTARRSGLEAEATYLGVDYDACCGAAARYKALSFLFDGVPTPGVPRPAPGEPGAIAADASAARRVGYREHGPFAAKLCNACHQAAATNALVAPGEQLCFRCHEFKLDKRYLHGPLASGGCQACHDPHSSQYRYLLVSESDTFCSFCHDSGAMAAIGAHAGGEEQCTTCHDAHMSDNAHLLK